MTGGRPAHDRLAVASLVLSLLWLGGAGSLAAVICGHRHAWRAHEARRPESGFAAAGLILGYLGLFAAVLLAAGRLVPLA